MNSRFNFSNIFFPLWIGSGRGTRTPNGFLRRINSPLPYRFGASRKCVWYSHPDLNRGCRDENPESLPLDDGSMVNLIVVYIVCVFFYCVNHGVPNRIRTCVAGLRNQSPWPPRRWGLPYLVQQYSQPTQCPDCVWVRCCPQTDKLRK